MWLNTVSGEMDLKIHPDEVEGFTSRLKSILGEDGELNVSIKECWRLLYCSLTLLLFLYLYWCASLILC